MIQQGFVYVLIVKVSIKGHSLSECWT